MQFLASFESLNQNCNAMLHVFIFFAMQAKPAYWNNVDCASVRKKLSSTELWCALPVLHAKITADEKMIDDSQPFYWRNCCNKSLIWSGTLRLRSSMILVVIGNCFNMIYESHTSKQLIILRKQLLFAISSWYQLINMNKSWLNTTKYVHNIFLTL